MKKIYIKPTAYVEEFIPNDFVSACNGKWTVSCNWESANAWEISNGNYRNGDVSHGDIHCGLSTNQVLTVENDKVIAMTEIGTDGLGNLQCTVYKDSSYKQKIDISTVKPNEIIYWTTKSGNKTWHHQGYVDGTYSGRPNHS